MAITPTTTPAATAAVGTPAGAGLATVGTKVWKPLAAENVARGVAEAEMTAVGYGSVASGAGVARGMKAPLLGNWIT